MMMLLGQAVGVRFAIDAVAGGAYGFECWKVFWRAIERAGLTEELGVVQFYEGDTAATLAGKENVFCIVVQCDDVPLQRVRDALDSSDEYQQVAATPHFVGSNALGFEPLAEVGRMSDGRLADAAWAGPAFEAVRAELAAPVPARGGVPRQEWESIAHLQPGLAVEQPAADLTGGQGPQEGMAVAPAGSARRGRRVLIAGVVSLLGTGVMAAATFMPWLSAEGGGALSGWDLYERQRDAGANGLFISGFFTNPDGGSLPLFTGLATILGGLGLAAVTTVFLVLQELLRRRSLDRGNPLVPGRPPRNAALVLVLHLLTLLVAVTAPLLTAQYYFKGGDASGVSLEYGLPLLWAATYVGFVANVVGAQLVWEREKLRVRERLIYLVIFPVLLAFAFYVATAAL